MRYLLRFLWAVLFLFLLSFTTKNTETIVLRYYFNYEWQAPLILVLLFFLAFGVVIGVLSCLGKIFKQRREIITLKKNCSVTDEHK
ncbi:MAG: LapA family protein [Betaproteobacteria bacterium]|nr:MAG: LapA family protein [Betaproteobacteria bacterium]